MYFSKKVFCFKDTFTIASCYLTHFDPYYNNITFYTPKNQTLAKCRLFESYEKL